jgi:hypothetical protein
VYRRGGSYCRRAQQWWDVGQGATLRVYALYQGSRTVAGPESKFSPRAVTAQVKEAQALDLRLAGHTYDIIATQIGYASRSSAYRAVERAFQRIRAHTDQTAEQLRQLEDARYDRMLQAIDAKVQQGDLAAIDRALRISKARRELWGPPLDRATPQRRQLRISKARRELWGLDAPTRIDTGVSPALAALIEQWQGLRDAPQLPSRVLPEQSYDVEAETADEPGSLIRLPSARLETWRMLDAVNQIINEPDDEDDHT